MTLELRYAKGGRMEPITTTAIIAAITALAQQHGGEAVRKAVADAYEGLKALLREKFGGEGKVIEAVESAESNREEDWPKARLQEVLKKANVDQDLAIRAAAQKILDGLKATPEGGRIVQTAIGTGIAQATAGGSATVTFHGPPPGTKQGQGDQ